MTPARIVEADIDPELHEAFREVLRQAPHAVDIGHLVALCFEAGVRAERDRAAQAAPAEWLLYEHDDGRRAAARSAEAATFANGEPAWHRVGPVAVHGAKGGA